MKLRYRLQCRTWSAYRVDQYRNVPEENRAANSSLPDDAWRRRKTTDAWLTSDDVNGQVRSEGAGARSWYRSNPDAERAASTDLNDSAGNRARAQQALVSMS
jgi:hypothetical protein